ncbi:hypothetical protein B0J17DRAFT_665616 [Rhizoctonia solani]|nr:hypothetical protein B0J17DRAFT_665616 [Rhizoctonia solani]
MIDKKFSLASPEHNLHTFNEKTTHTSALISPKHPPQHAYIPSYTVAPTQPEQPHVFMSTKSTSLDPSSPLPLPSDVITPNLIYPAPVWTSCYMMID